MIGIWDLQLIFNKKEKYKIRPKQKRYAQVAFQFLKWRTCIDESIIDQTEYWGEILDKTK